MTRLAVAALVFGLGLAEQSLSQSGAVIPQGGAGHAAEASCVILKRMGPADQVTSRLYSFGIRGKQFQYVEGKLPNGFPFHGRLTDHDVRNLQGRGAEIIVVNQNFTAEDLNQARAECRGETGKTPTQTEDKGKPPQAETKVANGTAAVAAEGSTDLAISSTPPGADIEIDGNFVGSTPSTVGITAGQHVVAVKKSGFKPWERKITVSSGHVKVDASLEPQPNS